MNSQKVLIFVIFLQIFIQFGNASLSDKYCGKDNCYTILRISKDASQKDIKQAFRKLAVEMHPDKAKQRGEDTTLEFSKINHAYEILTNEELRKSYDIYLNNPDKGEAYHYYNYYKAYYMPQTNPIAVVGISILLISGMQFLIRSNMHQQALNHIQRTDRFKRELNDLCSDQPDKDKEEIKKELLQNVSISGGHAAPKLKELFVFRIILSPYNIVYWIYDQIRLYYRYSYKKLEYLEKDQIYYTKKLLKLTDSMWEATDEDLQFKLLDKQLWIEENFKAYEIEQNEEREKQKQQFLSSNKGKRYQRYMKKYK